MASYKLLFAPNFQKDLKFIPKKGVLKILEAIDKLQSNPRPNNSKRLAGSDAYRIRIGVYRVVYDIKDNELIVLVLKTSHRKDV